MATTAMVTTAASTAESMMTMNQAARLAAWGEGWVIPMVLMKAFAMNWMNFMSLRWPAGEIVAEIVRGRIFSRMDESDAPRRASVHGGLTGEGLPERRRKHTLKQV